MSDSSVDALRLLQEDLRDEDYEVVIAGIQKLSTVALALGPQRVRSELLPFLIDYIDSSDNDEAQTEIARELANFTELLGGQQHAALLLTPLEKLCGEEEFVVRDTAVNSINTLLNNNKLTKPDITNKFLPMLKRLANGDWFTTRVSACGLFACCYSLVTPEVQAELRSLFSNLCNDDTPMVRKAAFQNLGKFALALQKQYFKTDIYPIVKAVSIDDIDSMRIYAIDACAALSKAIDSTEFNNVILPVVEALQDDASWRVRQQLALNFGDIAANLNLPNNNSNTNEAVGKKLMQIYCKLLRDKESEVRVAACDKMELSASIIKAGLLEYLAPVLESLAVDSVQNVRVAFSRSLVGLCPVFGRETSGKLLVPVVQQLTKDEYYEVRNNILNRLDILSEAIGSVGVTNSILPALIDLSKDPKWRVRMGVIEKCNLLAQHLGVKVFEKRFQQVIIGALSDHVYAIREVACNQIGLITKEFGGKWAAEKFLPAAFAIYDRTTNYLHRMTCLLVAEKCAEPGGLELIEKTLLPLVSTACTDDVPNVRIAAAKTMEVLIGQLIVHNQKSLAASKIQPLLQKMATDADPDVQYFSNLALKKL